MSIGWAIDNARYAIKVQSQVVAPEFRSRMVIVHHQGRLSVYQESAWVRPAADPMLPWSQPKGQRIAIVDLDGSATIFCEASLDGDHLVEGHGDGNMRCVHCGLDDATVEAAT